MAKKTARAASKPSQQRTKEEQWRRRMAQQSQVGAGSVLAEPEVTTDAVTYADGDAASATPRRTPASATSMRRTASASAGMAQRAAATAARNVRSRLTTYTLSLDEEMTYIRHDIRKLILMTAICVVVLIALAFLLPSFIK